jgi:hypothetical protein
MESENNCIFVSSFGIAKSVKQPPLLINKDGAKYNFNYNNNYGDTVYVRITDIINFYNYCLSEFKQPIVLITGDMDTTVPDDISNIFEILNHPKLLKWYSQNCSEIIHPKLFHSPIGLDYHTLSLVSEDIYHEWGKKMSPLEQENELLSCIKHFKKIKDVNCFKAISNFQHSTSLVINSSLKNMFVNEGTNLVKSNLNPAKLWKEMRGTLV